MFMPFDTCYLSAIEYDKELLDFAAENKVILAGPISIMALIANVTSLKNQHKQISIVDNLCAIITIVCLFLNFFIELMTCCSVKLSSELVASSIIKISGSL